MLPTWGVVMFFATSVIGSYLMGKELVHRMRGERG